MLVSSALALLYFSTSVRAGIGKPVVLVVLL